MTEDERLAHVKLGFDKARRNEVHAIFPRKVRHEVTRPVSTLALIRET